MEDHKIKKPTIFVSHATSDAEFANAVKQEIEKVFADGVKVFCTSSPGDIPVGSDWLQEVEHKLKTASAVIAIVTPVSIERPWLWFEVGATWSKGRSGECKIYPLCAQEIELSKLPSPLDRLQALSLGRAADLKILFEALIEQFGFGKLSSFRATNITKRIPKYKNVKIEDVDLNERTFYSGKYASYDDSELMEVIDSYLLYPDKERMYITNRESLIHNGMLVHFRQVDQQLELPPGTAKRLLEPVAARYNLVPSQKTENTIRFWRSP